ncbi:MAG TPA: substrate-binding domain-containing protein, partial [Kofleriaceae bacterium]|nr:substrate-binding domain-containing protein [Kofleriaceae bacterium]
MKTFWVIAASTAMIACKGDSPPPAPVGAEPVASDAARSTTPVELTILYSTEKKTWLAEQMAAFHGALRDGRPIHVTGKAVGSGEAMTAILDGSEKPVVFSPASTAYTTLLDHAWQSRDNHTKPVATTAEPLVLSPIVIAMWKPMA